uniref:6-phosphogluconolactonase n=1 Tax=Aureoumbra lagunensis TaxID=44058 RepID=A0A7S3NRA8_9STRA|mmetsp:Transcript_22805/g.29541  ORF Transcript_22805/g.29541 Transcript_22805/m.29541 type:complete len:383 (-) Transcript_22805:128-1276(-)
MKSKLVIGTYSQDLGFVHGKGLGIVVIDENDFTGEKNSSHKAAVVENSVVANSSYLIVVSEDYMVYALDERNDLGESGGRLHAFRIVDDKLEQVGEGVSCGDTSSCHLLATKNHVLVANYNGGGGSTQGSVACVVRDPKTGALGSVQVKRVGVSFPRTETGVNKERQDTSHAHMVLLDSPNSILVADLGSDVIWRLPYNPHNHNALGDPVPVALCDPGDGPRHMTLNRYLFVLNELSCTLSIFDLDKADMAMCKFPLLPSNNSSSTIATAAALRLTANAVYCSLRVVDGPGLISYYSIDPNTDLPISSSLCHIETGGSMPREIQILDNNSILLAANQNSDTITVFDIHPTTGALKPSSMPHCTRVGTPVCIAELPPPSSFLK